MATSSILNRLQNWLFHVLLRPAAGPEFRDIASGVRAVKLDVLRSTDLYGDFFRFMPVLVRREGFQVREVEVPQHQADAGTRVYSIGIYVRRLIDLLGLFFLMRFTQKPLRFFGLLGSAFVGVGGAILMLLLLQRLNGSPIADRPLLLLGVLLFSLGAQAIAIGLVGEIIVHFGASHRPLYRVREVGPDRPRGS
jgi:hypothetical protein